MVMGQKDSTNNLSIENVLDGLANGGRILLFSVAMYLPAFILVWHATSLFKSTPPKVDTAAKVSEQTEKHIQQIIQREVDSGLKQKIANLTKEQIAALNITAEMKQSDTNLM
jgi:hypothetical protein